ncbi:MAG: peptidoglycan editing factor PgeF [Alphaproteobacteria bacterium]|nr:peptidoglycan editing factor PgeF [Alphaproteobacteria bacterium]
MITLGALNQHPAIRHAFFGRQGGVSGGLFASLNCGFGSGDAAENVARNRAIAMARLGLAADALVTCRQVHSAEVIIVERPWRREEAPRADGMATARPGIALGILAADCAPVLLADPEAKVVGGAHGGWRGALGGVLDATVAAMEGLGAARGRIHAGIGPCIAQRSYEVGPEFPLRFAGEHPENARFFVPARREGHFLFDLGGYIAARLMRIGIAEVQRAPHDTVAEDDRFFSYRRACLRGEHDYGRALASIAIEA